MTKFTKTIGILGDKNPAPAAYVMQRIMSICREEYEVTSEEDFPHIALVSCDLPDMSVIGYERNQESDEEVLDELNKGYMSLSEAGAKTVYTAAETLGLSSRIFDTLGIKHIVNIDETGVYLAQKYTGKTVAVLGSSSTRRDAIYADSLIKLGIGYHEIDDQTQDLLDEIFFDFKSGSDMYELRDRLMDLCDDLLSYTDVVVLCSNDLSVIAGFEEVDGSVIDAQEIALRRLLELSK